MYADKASADGAYLIGDGLMNLPDINATAKLDGGYLDASDVDRNLLVVVSMSAETTSLADATSADPLPLLDGLAGQAVNKLRDYSA